MVEDREVKQSCVCDKVVRERWCVTKTDGVCDKVVCDKVVCDKVVCERWWVTKLCVKDGVWQSGVWKMVWRKMVCDKVVCERWRGERRCATKLCVKDGVVKDGVWQSGVWRMVCDKVVWDKNGVWKMVWQSGVKNGVSRMVWKIACDKVVCDKVVCERWGVAKWCVKDVVWRRWCVKESWKRVYQRWCVKDGVCVTECVKDGAWQRWRVTPQPAQCNKGHACHAKRMWMSPSALPATWKQGGCHQVPRLWVPRLPRKTTMDVGLCHPCHVKPRWMSPSATPATQSAAASCATKRAQARHPVPWVPKRPRLPCKTAVDVRLCHACHMTKWMSPSATPATQSAATSRATKRAQARHPVPWVPRLPRKTTVDVSHAEWRGVTRDQAGPSAPPSAMSASPATQNDRGCEILPRLPRETNVDVTKCHTCHAERKWLWDLPPLLRETKVGVTKCHACHAKCRGVTRDQAGPSAPPSAMSVTRATLNDRGCETVPRLPRETKVDVTKCHACHAKCVRKLCVKDGMWQRWVRKIVRDKDGCERWCVTKLCVKNGMWQRLYVTDDVWKMVCQKVTDGVWKIDKKDVSESCMWKIVYDKDGCERCCVKHGMWQSCMWRMVCDKDGMWQMVCEKWCVRKLYVKHGMWQTWVWKMVCETWYVTKLYVKDGMWQRLYVTDGVWKLVCQKVWHKWCVTGGRREAGGRRPRIQIQK